MITTIDKWYAKQCGIEVIEVIGGRLQIAERTYDTWTIKDPRCREIIRNWLLEQGYVVKAGKAMWTYSKLHKDYEAHKKDFHCGTDEIACITAIYEARGE